jgi:hypothetical protein
MDDGREQLELAKKHLARVQAAWVEPDWDDLAVYGFYCLECAVSAAAQHVGVVFSRSHPDKARAADILETDHGLPSVSDLLRDLNDARKAVGYGDADMPELEPEGVAARIEEYVQAVEDLLGD